VLEREVRANLVYRDWDFTRVGGGNMPDAKRALGHSDRAAGA